MNILFITSNRIGDAVLSSSLLSYLISKHPNSKITIACGPLAAPLFANVPGLEKIIIFKDRRMGKHWFKMWRECFFMNWGITVDLRGSLSTYFLFSRKRYIWRSKKVLIHKVQQLADLLKIKEVISPKVWLSEENKRIAKKKLPDGSFIIALAPTANWKGKEWEASKFVSLLEKLRSETGIFPNSRVAIFATKGEKERSQLIIDKLPKEVCIDLVGKLGIDEVVACIERCDFFIGNDSGLMHIAAAAGVPTVGLFGPSKDEHYSPFGNKCVAIRTPESYKQLMKDFNKREDLMCNLKVEDVLDVISKLWKRIKKE